ncbi:MAG: flagellar hook-length control protein FliK [Lacipirellulaceae bacterium]
MNEPLLPTSLLSVTAPRAPAAERPGSVDPEAFQRRLASVSAGKVATTAGDGAAVASDRQRPDRNESRKPSQPSEKPERDATTKRGEAAIKGPEAPQGRRNADPSKDSAITDEASALKADDATEEPVEASEEEAVDAAAIAADAAASATIAALVPTASPSIEPIGTEATVEPVVGAVAATATPAADELPLLDKLSDVTNPEGATAVEAAVADADATSAGTPATELSGATAQAVEASNAAPVTEASIAPVERPESAAKEVNAEINASGAEGEQAVTESPGDTTGDRLGDNERSQEEAAQPEVESDNGTPSGGSATVGPERIDTDATASRDAGAPPPVEQSPTTDASNRAATAAERPAPRSDTPSASRSAAGGPAVDPARFVTRVSRAFEAAADRGGGPIRLRLSPPELGSLEIRLEIRDGAMTATVEADTPAARQALLENLPALRDRLAEQQVRVERFDVNVRDDGQGGASPRGDAQQQQRDDSRPTRRDATAPQGASTAARVAPAAPRSMRVGPDQINVVA